MNKLPGSPAGLAAATYEGLRWRSELLFWATGRERQPASFFGQAIWGGGLSRMVAPAAEHRISDNAWTGAELSVDVRNLALRAGFGSSWATHPSAIFIATP
jgi:hypothetical protein